MFSSSSHIAPIICWAVRLPIPAVWKACCADRQKLTQPLFIVSSAARRTLTNPSRLSGETHRECVAFKAATIASKPTRPRVDACQVFLPYQASSKSGPRPTARVPVGMTMPDPLSRRVARAKSSTSLNVKSVTWGVGFQAVSTTSDSFRLLQQIRALEARQSGSKQRPDGQRTGAQVGARDSGGPCFFLPTHLTDRQRADNITKQSNDLWSFAAYCSHVK